VVSHQLRPHPTSTDGELILASRAAPEAFATIFERHFTTIHRYLARRVGTDLADDLAAQVFTIAFARRHVFRDGVADARPWLYGIATNLVRNHRRSEYRLLGAMARLGADAAPRHDATGVEEQAVDDPRVARALADLDVDQRDVLLLHAWGELTHAEIALSLGIPQGTVASRLARGRQRLRDALSGETQLGGLVGRTSTSKEAR